MQRQAFAGMLWSKQFYHYDVDRWLRGRSRPAGSAPRALEHGRNSDWTHLYNADVISMPDKWEYPWYAAWDLAFHCIPLALVDPDFAKEQLMLLLREWYMHPNGQIPAYEWAFSDVNPPVHAWAAWRVYKIDKKRRGDGDRAFLGARLPQAAAEFHLVGQPQGCRRAATSFKAAFWDWTTSASSTAARRCRPAAYIEQSDGTSWMGMYCLNMMAIALELARDNRAYEDVATKFFEHFVYICRAMNNIGGEKIELWDRDRRILSTTCCICRTATIIPLQVRSMVGLIPLFAVETLELGIDRQRCPASSGACSGSSRTCPNLRDIIETQSYDATDMRRFLSLVSRDDCAVSWLSCWTKRSFSRPTASARFRAITRTILTFCRDGP